PGKSSFICRTPIGWTLATGGSASPPTNPPGPLATSPKSEPAKSATILISALPLVNLANELGESGLPPASTSHPFGASQANCPPLSRQVTYPAGAGTSPPQPG